VIETWRSFIAITPGQEIQSRIRELMRELGPACREAEHNVRWVHPGKVHLTLRFLGDIPVPLGLSLEDACRPLGGVERMKLEYKGLGAFPDASRPRVLWLGISDTDGRLSEMHETLTGILADRGIEPEKRSFTPHVTLGRIRKPGGGDLSPVIESLADQSIGEEVVSKVIFYKSTLDPGGAIHEAKWVVNLGRERPARERSRV
jgi:2'-5' RNA ligase